MRSLVSGVLLTTALCGAGCAPAPPALPYLAVMETDGRCGYDWNEAATSLEGLKDWAARWDGSREVLLVFHLTPVSDRCIEKARKAYESLDFSRTYIIEYPRPKLGEPALIPPRGAR